MIGEVQWCIRGWDQFIGGGTQFIINKRTDAEKTDVNLIFTITRPQQGQISVTNEGKRRCKPAVHKDK